MLIKTKLKNSMHTVRLIILSTCFLMIQPMYPVNIISGAKSLLGKVTQTFQRSISSVTPDVSIELTDDSLQNAESRLHHVSQTAAHDLKDVAHELDTIAARHVHASSQELHTLSQRLDTIIQGHVDNAAQELDSIIQRLEAIIHTFEHDLDEKIETIYQRCTTIVERTRSHADDVADTAIRQASYALSGTGATCLGMYILAYRIMHRHPDDPWMQYLPQYMSAAAFIGAGYTIVSHSREIAEQGVSQYIGTMFTIDDTQTDDL